MITPALSAAALVVAALLQEPAGQGFPATQGAAEVPASAPATGAPQSDSVTAAAGVAPDTVTVGQHFRAVVRVTAPPGTVVRFPRFTLLDPVQATDSLRVVRDSSGSWTATYRLVAWTTSDSLVATFPFRLHASDGSYRDLRLRVPFPHVKSVLPGDSSLHLPRPAKAVIPIAVTGPTPRGWLLPAALLLVAVLGVGWLVLRGRVARPSPALDPRTAALAKLATIEKEGLPARGLLLEYHVQTSRVLREYLATRAGWGEDLTTTEVAAALRAKEGEEGAAGELDRLLRHADRVKFSGGGDPADAATSLRFGAAVRGWITGWPAAVGPAQRSEAA